MLDIALKTTGKASVGEISFGPRGQFQSYIPMAMVQK
jgi:hypothetical protein